MNIAQRTGKMRYITGMSMHTRVAAVGIFFSVCAGAVWADALSDCASKPNLDQRIQSCTEAIAQNAANKRQLTSAYNLRGSAYAQKGDFGRAIADLTKGIELDPTQAVVYAARGEAYRFMGDVERAIADYNRALEVDPKHATAYHARGLALASKGNYAAGIADLTKAIEANPRSVQALHDRAMLNEITGAKDKAIADLRAALRLDPGHKASLDAFGRLNTAGGPQRQIVDEFSRLLQRVQQSVDHEQRIALAQEALKLEPNVTPWPLQATRDLIKGELHFHIAGSYDRRQQGDRADNVESAITAYEHVLAFWKLETLPRGWAQAQHNLTLAYSNRTRGDRAENLEKAVAGNQAALIVRTRQAAPLDWAQTQYNSGLVYSARVRGDRADNLEKAIAAYEASLTVRTREAHPELWAASTHSLASAYVGRIQGERADNLERAIAGFEAGVDVFARDKFPRQWADAQDNLGTTYGMRVVGERADNLEKSLSAYEAALSVRTRDGDPEAWAQSQINIGATYNRRIRGDRANNQDKALAAYEAALTVYKREALPLFWAATQSNIALIYLNRLDGDRADNVERAIAGLQAAHTVFTRETYPQEWGGTHRSLANAFLGRVGGERSENLKKAIAGYEAALGVLTRNAFPRDHLQTARLLAGASLLVGDWQKAGAAAATAREAFLVLFGQGLDEAGAESLIESAGPLFADAAFAAAQRGEPAVALALAAEGRAKLMATALKLQDLDLDPAHRTRLKELRASIREEIRAYASASGVARASTLDRLAALRQVLLELMQEANRSGGKAPENISAAAETLIPKGGAIVLPVVTAAGSKMLLLAQSESGKALTVLDLPELSAARIGQLMHGDGKVGGSGGWLGAFNIQYQPGGDLGEWTAAIESIGAKLWTIVVGRIDQALEQRGVKPGARVIWLPSGALGLLPLGLAHGPQSKIRFGEKYELVTAPSLDALAHAFRQAAQAQAPSLAAIVNPTGDLPFTEVESALVAAHFEKAPRIVLDKFTATPRAVLAGLKDKSYWHFSSHGQFDWENARRAGLLMKDAEILTIGSLLDAEGSLGRPRLVVLSACETGLYDAARNADEFVGLPATFIQLGATGVLGTLWQVDDLATSLLMAKFYDLHMRDGFEPSAALRSAQAWLRDANRDELAAYARSSAVAAKLDESKLANLENALATSRRPVDSRFDAMAQRLQPRAGSATEAQPIGSDLQDQAPFAHPYYWGGFVFTGL
jgi:CHAT domain-containing protein/tetratricopeptide (TPR) repeat protein